VRGARFTTEPFRDPPYYGVRLWVGEPTGARFELEFTHQKLYYRGAESGGEVVDALTVTDGLNLLTANVAYSWPAGGFLVAGRLGVGLVIPHPESSVRDLVWGVDGDPAHYHLGGLAARAGLALELPFGPAPAAGALEGQLTYAHTELLIAGGHIAADFFTAHLTLAAGFWYAPPSPRPSG
jgi:hypothetical protein